MKSYASEIFGSLFSRRRFLKASFFGVCSLFCKPASAALFLAGLPEGRLSLYNVHTNEKLGVTYRDATGRYDDEALNELDHFLRCHYTGESIKMDVAAIEFLNTVCKKLGGNREIRIISGYRSPEYNRLLLMEGRGVVKNSLHLQGKAIDFNIPCVSLENIRQTALSLRLGGVGYYPKSDFVHVDSGRFRYW